MKAIHHDSIWEINVGNLADAYFALKAGGLDTIYDDGDVRVNAIYPAIVAEDEACKANPRVLEVADGDAVHFYKISAGLYDAVKGLSWKVDANGNAYVECARPGYADNFIPFKVRARIEAGDAKEDIVNDLKGYSCANSLQNLAISFQEFGHLDITYFAVTDNGYGSFVDLFVTGEEADAIVKEIRDNASVLYDLAVVGMKP